MLHSKMIDFSKVVYALTFLGILGYPRVSNANDDIRDLHIIFATDITGIFKTWSVFGNVVPLAIETINNRSNILPGFRIVPHFMDSQCLVSEGLHAMYKMFYTPPTKIFMVGPLCSHVCLATGETSHLWNVTQISASCVDPALSDKKTYKRFFRTTQSDVGMIPTRIKLMEKFKWNKVALFHQAEGPFASVTAEMRKVFTNTSVSIITSEVVNNDPRQPIVNLQENDVRIILAGMFYQFGVKVFCEAYKLGFYGPHIVWMLPGWWDVMWWQKGAGDTDCSAEQILETVQYTIYIPSVWKNPVDQPSLSGFVQSEIDHLVDVWSNYTKPNVHFIAASHFDSTMAAALALNLTQTKLTENGDTRSIADFDYKDRDIADLILESMYELHFQGIKGVIDFDEFGDVHTDMEVFQQQGRERVKVAWHEVKKDKIHWLNGGLIWQDDKPPVDSTRIILNYLYVSTSVYSTMCTLSVIGIAVNFALIIFNIMYRDRRVIKMSSPNINTLILVGCMLVYATVFFELRPESISYGNVMCIVKTFIFIIGFCLAFGGLFSKTWRVHVILTRSMKSAKKTVISDSQLFLIVGMLVMVDTVVLVTWQVYDPYSVVARNLTTQAIYGESMVIYQMSSCISDHSAYFQGALFVIQGLMLVFGAFLAWETRKVKLEALNDSKFIGVCIYNVTILSIMGAGISMVIKEDPDASYGFTSGFIVAGTSFTSCLLFIPKILHVKGIVSVAPAVPENSSVSVVPTSHCPKGSDE